MNERALSALLRAWATTVIALSLLVTAIALARAWDNTIYFQGLEEALNFEV
jgi:hypothetical protein